MRSHPLAQEFLENYIVPLGISAALVAPVFKGGMKAGVVCFEETGSPRPWSVDEQNFAILMADMVSLALEARARKVREILDRTPRSAGVPRG